MTASWVRVLFGALAIALSIVGGPAAASGPWQADPVFRIDPSRVPGDSNQAAKYSYRLLDPQGGQIGRLVERPAIDPLDWITVPHLPGVYEVEAWVEDATGHELRRGSAILHFDDVEPASPAPEGPSRWLLGGEAAQLRINHPASPLPLSGIRGYAFSLDRGGGSFPCANPRLCTEPETDLAGGIDNDSISLGTLPEGTTYARVVAVSGAGVPSQLRFAVFRVDATPPSLSLTGTPNGWSAEPVRLTAHAADKLSGMAAAGPMGPFTAIAVDGDAPTRARGNTATAWVSGSGAHAIAFYARDAAGNIVDGTADSGSPESALVRIDEDPPRVEFADAQDPAEPERIEAVVSDPLSGPSATHGSIAVRLAGTRTRFETLPTQVVSKRLIARWDSDAYPSGKYEFLATGFDAAGNQSAGSKRVGGSRMVLVNPLKAQVALAARLSGDLFSGRLRSLGSGPLAGRALMVIETFTAGAAPRQRITTVTTSAEGRFSLRVGRGPSRDVVAHFGGTRLLSRGSSPSAHIERETAIRFRASSVRAIVGGKPIAFRGRVGTAGTAPRAAAKLPIALEFRYPGSGWEEFRTVEADAQGRFRYAYRFSDDDSRGIRFQFRAHVKAARAGHTDQAPRPVKVVGR